MRCTMPSRFESVFAVDTAAAAGDLRSRFGGAGRIVAVEAWFKADMNLLTHRPDSVLVMSYFAELYWTGAPHPEGADMGVPAHSTGDCHRPGLTRSAERGVLKRIRPTWISMLPCVNGQSTYWDRSIASEPNQKRSSTPASRSSRAWPTIGPYGSKRTSVQLL